MIRASSSFCIVTPDAIGPVKNGGIGTHCYFLARHLAQRGHAVDLLLTIPVGNAEARRWREWYAERGVTLRFLQEFPDLPYPVSMSRDLQISLKVREALRDSSYAQIHFQDWRAHGFHCIQAKRTLGAFAATRLTVTAHSPTEWVLEGMESWNPHSTEGTRVMWCERYCVEHCDTLVSPSRYMLEWLRQRGWKTPEDSRVVPNICDVADLDCAPYLPDRATVAFFGRLETRKGLLLFCAALQKLSPSARKKIRKILFVGKPGLCGGQPAAARIAAAMESLGMPYEVHDALDAFAAQALLRESKALIVIPSLMDNLPYAVVECVCRRMPVIAAAVGGIPEILPPAQCFSPDAGSLAACLERIATEGFPSTPDGVPYSAQRARSGWDDVAALPTPRPAIMSVESPPLISVCVAHYNHGKYLDAAVRALARQTYDNFEVIVTDDGSTDRRSQEVFEQLQTTCDSRFRFFRKKNEGLGATRNFCVRQARGDYLVFYDSDNIALPYMLDAMARGMPRSGCDALTCHFRAFAADAAGENPSPLYGYAPMGPDLATGMLENVFGDANFIIRKSVFDALGGFVETRHGCEDWEFLARLSLAGYSQDVLPDPLFWYRHTGDGLRSTMSLYHGQHLVLSAYARYLPSFAAAAAQHLLLPMFGGHGASNAVIIRNMLRLGLYLEETYTRLFPGGSRRQRMLSRIWARLSRCSLSSCGEIFRSRGKKRNHSSHACP